MNDDPFPNQAKYKSTELNRELSNLKSQLNKIDRQRSAVRFKIKEVEREIESINPSCRTKKVLPEGLIKEYQDYFDYGIFVRVDKEKGGLPKFAAWAAQNSEANLFKMGLIDEHDKWPQIHFNFGYPGINKEEGWLNDHTAFDAYVNAKRLPAIIAWLQKALEFYRQNYVEDEKDPDMQEEMRD